MLPLYISITGGGRAQPNPILLISPKGSVTYIDTLKILILWNLFFVEIIN